ncbi:uncharacterized protein LOC103970165 [Musa acuminata AAA Group]|uniref:uncharacterized protein LOC103970165 n=1 Tax=Musa acuminata AAA Group TaxID=214697 RepID=UPI0031D77EF4
MQIRRSSQLFSDGFLDGAVSRSRENGTIATIPASSSVSSFSSSSSDSPPKVNYIEHRVSKMDTLPGVAIKYGVEVEDVKRLNGLTTDIQMFAHKSLQIPLPGRHPPSTRSTNGSAANGFSKEHTPPRHPSNGVLDLLQSLKLKTPSTKVSPAMNNLRSYYGLTQFEKDPVLEGTEMAVYRIGDCCLADEILPTEAPFSDSLIGQHQKSRSLVNGFSLENGKTAQEKTILDTAENNEIEKAVRRRQKNDSVPSLGTPELLLEDNNSGFSGRKGKGLSMRPKLGSRTDVDMVHPNATPNGDSFMTNGSVFVRKSSSTSSLQESENSSSIWPTSKWTLNPEVLARPLFDGLPKPINVWKNKAALD